MEHKYILEWNLRGTQPQSWQEDELIETTSWLPGCVAPEIENESIVT